MTTPAMRRYLALVAIAGFTACESASSPAAPLVMAFPDLDAWSGGTLLAVTSWSATQALPIVLVDGDTVSVRAVDDTTVAIAMPVANRSVDVTWAYGVAGGSVTVHLHGFVSQRPVQHLNGFVLPVAGGPPRFLANGDSTLVLMDARTDVPVVIYPRSMHDASCMTGPGLTFDPDVFLLESGPDCRLQAWTLGSQPSWVDSLGITTYGGAAAWLSPNVVAWHEPPWRQRLWIRGPSAPALPVSLDNGMGFRLSPRGDRAIPLGGVFLGGSPVFDSNTGAVAFTLGWIQRSRGAAFSDDGDTLFVLAEQPYNSHVLFAVNASTGDSLTATSIDSLRVSYVWDLTLDPNGEWIYVAAEQVPGPLLVMVVVRRATLTVEAIIPFQPQSGCAEFSDRLMIGGSERRLYWVRASHWPGPVPACIATFDLVP